MADGRHLGNR